MKKITPFIFAIWVLTASATASFAEVVQGPIEVIDKAKNEIVVKNNTSGADTVIVVHPKIIATLQNGTFVKASLKPGSNIADTLEVKIG